MPTEIGNKALGNSVAGGQGTVANCFWLLDVYTDFLHAEGMSGHWLLHSSQWCWLIKRHKRLLLDSGELYFSIMTVSTLDPVAFSLEYEAFQIHKALFYVYSRPRHIVIYNLPLWLMCGEHDVMLTYEFKQSIHHWENSYSLHLNFVRKLRKIITPIPEPNLAVKKLMALRKVD